MSRPLAFCLVALFGVTSSACGGGDVSSPVETDASTDVSPELGGDTLPMLEVGDDTGLAKDTALPDDTTLPLDSSTDDAAEGTVDGGSDAETCAKPISGTLSLPSDSATGTLSGTNTDIVLCAGSYGPEAYYRLHVPTKSGVSVSVDADDPTVLDPVVAIRHGKCDYFGEILCNADRPDGDGGAQINAMLDAGDYYVYVDSMGAGGKYTVKVAPFTPVANGSCATPTAVVDGTKITGEDSSRSLDASGTLCGLTGYHSLYYSITVPPDHTLVTTVTPTSKPAWGPFVRVLSACGATSCLATGPYFTNTSTSDASVVVEVADNDSHVVGKFDVAFSIQAAQTNAKCSSPKVLADGDVLHGENTALARTSITPCVPTATGNSLFYSATIPVGKTMYFRGWPTGPASASPLLLRLLDSCASTTCADHVFTGPVGIAVLGASNTGTTPRSVVLAVGGGTGTFDLSATLGTENTNTSCSTPTVLAAGHTVLANQNVGIGPLTGYKSCGFPVPENTIYYKATLPPGGAFTAYAAQVGESYDVQPVLVGACSDTTCLPATIPTTGILQPQLMEYVNTGTTAEDLYYVLRGSGRSDLNVIVGPPFGESTLASSCDDMTGATVLRDGAGGDVTSPMMPMPFPFPFFADVAARYSVSSNGFLQLSTRAILVAVPVTAPTHAALPGATPTQFVAPYWADLDPGTSTTSARKVKTFGVAPGRHHTVEWTDWALKKDATARLTFQAKLFESGVIEFHYCKLSAATIGDATGGVATIGIESPAGQIAAQHSFDTPSSISTTSALRFTPK